MAQNNSINKMSVYCKMEYFSRRQIFAILPQKHEDKYSRFLIFVVVIIIIIIIFIFKEDTSENYSCNCPNILHYILETKQCQ